MLLLSASKYNAWWFYNNQISTISCSFTIEFCQSQAIRNFEMGNLLLCQMAKTNYKYMRIYELQMKFVAYINIRNGFLPHEKFPKECVLFFVYLYFWNNDGFVINFRDWCLVARWFFFRKRKPKSKYELSKGTSLVCIINIYPKLLQNALMGE